MQLDDYDIKCMSPAKRTHSRVIMKLSNILFSFLEKKGCRVYSDERPILIPKDILEKYKKLYGEKFKDQFPKKYFIPDLVVVCDKEIDREEFIEGSPTIVVEILSAKTFRIDMGYKKEMYKEMGVVEYWIVDPSHKFIEIFNFLINESIFLSIENVNEAEFNLEKEKPIKSFVFPDLEIFISRLFDEDY